MSDTRKLSELIKGAKPIEIIPISKTADIRPAISSLQPKASRPSKLYLIALFEI